MMGIRKARFKFVNDLNISPLIVFGLPLVFLLFQSLPLLHLPLIEHNEDKGPKASENYAARQKAVLALGSHKHGAREPQRPDALALRARALASLRSPSLRRDNS
jgi:hypothetical protein